MCGCVDCVGDCFDVLMVVLVLLMCYCVDGCVDDCVAICHYRVNMFMFRYASVEVCEQRAENFGFLVVKVELWTEITLTVPHTHTLPVRCHTTIIVFWSPLVWDFRTGYADEMMSVSCIS
jgi:hypothetical protein